MRERQRVARVHLQQLILVNASRRRYWSVGKVCHAIAVPIVSRYGGFL